MARLAASLDPAEPNRVGSRLYERFRPEVPAGARGRGAKGVLDLARIEGAAGRCPPRTHRGALGRPGRHRAPPR